jgi:Ca2+-transporting ATPase
MLGLIFANRSISRHAFAMLRTPNPALWWVVSGGLIFLAVVLYVPYLREVFRFAGLPAGDLLICLGAGVLSALWFEIVKFTRTQYQGKN